MTIALDHLKVSSRNRWAAAELLTKVLQVPWSATGVGAYCAVFVNDGLTLDFDQCEAAATINVEHYCFRLSEAAFDALLGRLAALGLAYRSLPHGAVDEKVNTEHGGRIVYWSEPDGHV